MRRRVLIALLTFGTIAGYAAGFAHVYRWHHHGHGPGGHCRHDRAHDPESRNPTAPWAPSAQAQAPTADPR